MNSDIFQDFFSSSLKWTNLTSQKKEQVVSAYRFAKESFPDLKVSLMHDLESNDITLRGFNNLFLIALGASLYREEFVLSTPEIFITRERLKEIGFKCNGISCEKKISKNKYLTLSINDGIFDADGNRLWYLGFRNKNSGEPDDIVYMSTEVVYMSTVNNILKELV